MKTTDAGAKSGCKVLRRIVREADPAIESTKYGLQFAFQQLLSQTTPLEDHGDDDPGVQG